MTKKYRALKKHQSFRPSMKSAGEQVAAPLEPVTEKMFELAAAASQELTTSSQYPRKRQVFYYFHHLIDRPANHPEDPLNLDVFRSHWLGIGQYHYNAVETALILYGTARAMTNADGRFTKREIDPLVKMLNEPTGLSLWVGVADRKLKEPGWGQRFDEQALSNIVWSLAKLATEKVRLEPRFVRDVVLASIEIIDTFKTQGLSALIGGTASLEKHNKIDVPDFVPIWIRAAQPKLRDFSEQQLSNSIWGVGMQARRSEDVPPGFVADWMGFAKPKLEFLSELSAINMAWGLIRLDVLGVDINRSFVHRVISEAQIRIDGFTERNPNIVRLTSNLGKYIPILKSQFAPK